MNIVKLQSNNGCTWLKCCEIGRATLFIYLLDYISLVGISKCGDRGKIKIELGPKMYGISVCLSELYLLMAHCAHLSKFQIKNMI